MTIANVTKTNNNTSDANPSWTHTPVGGDPRGILIATDQPYGGSLFTSGTYGGEAMTEVPLSPNSHTSGEQGSVSGWFLGTGIPTGAQTVQFNGGESRSRVMTSYSVTADADMEVQDTDDSINSDSVANPTGTLSLGGNECFVVMSFGSGHSAVGSVSPLTNWTSDNEFDFSSNVGGVYSYDIISTADVTIGWTQTADDAWAIGIAIKEIAAPAGGDLLLTNRSIANYQGIRQ